MIFSRACFDFSDLERFPLTLAIVACMHACLLLSHQDTVEKDQLFNAITEIPCIGQKARWALKWIKSSTSFAERLVAFAAVEVVHKHDHARNARYRFLKENQRKQSET